MTRGCDRAETMQSRCRGPIQTIGTYGIQHHLCDYHREQFQNEFEHSAMLRKHYLALSQLKGKS